MTTIRELLQDDDKRTVSRTAFGLGVGAGLGFVVGGPAGAGIGALAGGALGALSDPGPQKGELTEARERLFWKAMASENAQAIGKAAELLREAELFDHADALRRRVDLLGLPDEEREARAARLLRALCSCKVSGVETIAEFFRAQGALVAAAMLQEHAADLRALQGGKVDQACLERFERRLAFVGERVDEERRAGAQANAERARELLAAASATSATPAP